MKVGRALHRDGLPRKVVDWLHDHKDEELSLEDVAVRWAPEMDPRAVLKSLSAALFNGYVEGCVNERGQRVLRAPRRSA